MAACGGQATVSIPPSTNVVPDDRLSEVVSEVLQADARLEPLDSLYAPDALVIVDGEVRYGIPRFAGIGGRGSVAVTATRLEVRGTMAWVQAEYRWVRRGGRQRPRSPRDPDPHSKRKRGVANPPCPLLFTSWPLTREDGRRGNSRIDCRLPSADI
jgi:hypothetical protein